MIKIYIPEPEDTTYLDCWYHGNTHFSYTCHSCNMPLVLEHWAEDHTCRYCGKYQFETKSRYEKWPQIYEQLTRSTQNEIY